jgi:hypothetical protein
MTWSSAENERGKIARISYDTVSYREEEEEKRQTKNYLGRSNSWNDVRNGT